MLLIRGAAAEYISYKVHNLHLHSLRGKLYYCRKDDKEEEEEDEEEEGEVEGKTDHLLPLGPFFSLRKNWPPVWKIARENHKNHYYSLLSFVSQ